MLSMSRIALFSACCLRSALSAYNSVSLKTADTKGLKSFLSNPNGALVQQHANPAGGTCK